LPLREETMYIQPTTILLINSPHANWVGLQTMLCKFRHVQVIGKAQERGEVVRIATVEQPDIIFVGSDVPGLPVVPLVQELRELSPTSRIVVVGKLLDCADHAYLMQLGIAAFVVWKDVTEVKLRIVIEGVLNDLRMVSIAAADRRAMVDRRRGPRMSDIVVEPMERTVLKGLGVGLTQREIAHDLRVSETTVERMIATLRGKFGVATTNALCGQAGRLEFLD
jgi:two-component system nitrate/nitrite response regulator NarL